MRKSFWPVQWILLKLGAADFLRWLLIVILLLLVVVLFVFFFFTLFGVYLKAS